MSFGALFVVWLLPIGEFVYDDYKRNDPESLSPTHQTSKIGDNYYEDMVGLPDISWVNGLTCSDTFKDLSVFQRKILIKYYLEDWNDRQIAEHLGAHVNTINQKRREAIKTICNEVGIPKSELKRNRKSGKRVSLPT